MHFASRLQCLGMTSTTFTFEERAIFATNLQISFPLNPAKNQKMARGSDPVGDLLLG